MSWQYCVFTDLNKCSFLVAEWLYNIQRIGLDGQLRYEEAPIKKQTSRRLQAAGTPCSVTFHRRV